MAVGIGGASVDRGTSGPDDGPDSRTYLSGILLAGLLLNSMLGWSWADPVVALVIAAVVVKEGRDAWRGRHCC